MYFLFKLIHTYLIDLSIDWLIGLIWCDLFWLTHAHVHNQKQAVSNMIQASKVIQAW